MRTSHVILGLLIVASAALVIPARCVEDPHRQLLMTVWGMPFEDALFRDVYARGFEREHPGLTVQYQRYVDQDRKYEAWHAVGRGADVMRVPISSYHGMVAKGMLEPLDRFIHDPNVGLTPAEQADFIPSLRQPLAVDGRRYALPSDNAQYGVYYNTRIFDEYDRAHPDAPLGYPNVNWTWEDLKRAHEKLTITGPRGEIVQYGVSFELWAWPFLTFLKQAGGEMWDEAQTTTLVDSDAGVEALEFLVTLIPKNSPLRSIEMAETASGPDDLFKVGKLAILLDGSWRAPNLEKESPQLDFAIAPLPRHRKRAVVSGSVLWAVSVHSRNKDMAWQMVKWLTRREQALEYWNKLRVAPPALLSVVRSEEFRSTTGLVNERGEVVVPPMPRAEFADRAAWLQVATGADPDTGQPIGFIPAALYEADLELKLARALVEAVRGDKTPRQALQDAVRETHQIIDRDRAARGLPAVRRS